MMYNSFENQIKLILRTNYMDSKIKKITVITGYYGSGKTNLAVNIALYLKEKGAGRVSAVDLDIVNPYFRCSDFEELFRKENIAVYSPLYAGTNLDIPALDFDMESIISQSSYTVIDVGGDDAGAYALGRYKNIFKRYENDISVLYVYNRFRREDYSAEEAADNLRSIEKASGLKCTSLVNNSNLGAAVENEILPDTSNFQKKLEQLTGLKTVLCSSEKNSDFTVKRLVKLPWERSTV